MNNQDHTQNRSSESGSAPRPPLLQTVGFVGTGNMAEALIKGLLLSKVLSPGQVVGSDPRKVRCDEIHKRYGIRATRENDEVVAASEILVLSVKPQILKTVCQEITRSGKLQKDCLVISIAAGVPLAVIEGLLPHGTRVVRTMPNTPALVGAGATAISPGSYSTAEDLEIARQIFDSVGKSVVLDEEQLDAVTGLSGSGPAYLFLIIEALSDAGVKVGLSRYNALSLAAQTVLGSAKLLIETGEHPGHLKDMVTSPGGTAIAGLHTLEAGGLRTTLMNAVEAATRRSKELGEIALSQGKGSR